MQPSLKKRGCFPRAFRWLLGAVTAVVLLVLVILGVVLHTAIYHRFVLFPKQAAAWEALRAQRLPVTLEDGWNEYRGVMHAHSELSHDSKIAFPDIAAALKKADVNFIFMTDHTDEGLADYSKGWKGMHEGILFVRGYEMDGGFMPWGIPDDTVLKVKENPALQAKRIQDLGGVLFFAHCEETRRWELPELTGMEIYNLHVDFKNADIKSLAPEILLSLWSYPDQVLRLIFQRPTAFLKRWDELNKTRHITGIAANDAHQNVGVRGVYTAKDTLRLLDTAHTDETIKEIKINAFTRPLLRLLFGPLVPDRQIFRMDLDPYERSARYVNTHLLAKECTEPDLLDALRAGRAFVGFDMIADARGFKFLAEGGGKKVVMGESIPLTPDLMLKMASPYKCRFTVLQDGKPVGQEEASSFSLQVPQPGKYRVEADLTILGKWTPWVYTNPIEVTNAQAL